MTVFQPGDVVWADTGHLLWVHGGIGKELHLTSSTGVYTPMSEAKQRYGDLALRYRSADHQPTAPLRQEERR